MSFKKLTRFLLLVAALAPFGLSAATVHIVLVGDSTVTENAGWGAGFKQCLVGDVKLSNTARGGRSSAPNTEAPDLSAVRRSAATPVGVLWDGNDSVGSSIQCVR